MAAGSVEGVTSGGGLVQLTRSDIAVVVGSFAVSRLLLILVGYFVLSTYEANFHVGSLLPNLFVRWDSGWYIELAKSGYSPAEHPGTPGATNYAFYPLYPLLMWLLSSATGLSLAMAGVLISNVCFLAALFVIFALAERWSGDKAVAGLTVVLISLVPESFIFSAVYTESLFMLLTSASMLLFERKQNFAAGICAGLSSAVRSNGIFVALYFGAMLLRERGWRRALKFWDEPERYLGIVMAPLGLFAFWWFGMLTVGDAFAQKSAITAGWHWETDWPWNNIISGLQLPTFRDRFVMWSSIAMFLGSLSLLRKDSWPLFVYCLVNFLLFWTGTIPNSLLRYCIVLFPIFYGVARLLAGRPLLAGGLLSFFAAGSVMLMGLWAIGSWIVL